MCVKQKIKLLSEWDGLESHTGLFKSGIYPDVAERLLNWSRNNFRFILLDGTAVSLFGLEPGSPGHTEAVSWLASHPLSEYPNSQDWNGALDKEQLSWLDEELTEAAKSGEKVSRVSLRIAAHAV